MNDILDEVLRDQKDEINLKYFKKFLPIVISLTIITAMIMLGYNWQKNKTNLQNQQTSDNFIKALQTTNSTDLLNSIINNNNSNLNELVKLELVNLNIKDNDLIQAKKNLEEIINQKNYSKVTTSYARIIWLGLIIDQKNVSADELNTLNDYFDYFNDSDQLFYSYVNLLKFNWLIKNKQLDLAKNLLTVIMADENLPNIFKEQAKELFDKSN